MREIDDVEHAEDDGKPEAQQRVKRTVNESDQQLAEQGLRADAEQFEHGRSHGWPGSIPLPGPRRVGASALHQRAAALCQGSEGLVSRDRSAVLVVLPGGLRFLRILAFAKSNMV